MADGTAGTRAGFALTGGLAGWSLYLLTDWAGRGLIGGRPALALIALAAGFFTTVLVLSGPVPPRRTLGPAALLGAGLAGLMLLASLRHAAAADLLDAPFAVLAALVVMLLPQPFLLAQMAGPGWDHYPSLFRQSWALVVRVGAGWLFALVVWALAALSAAVLDLVGIDILERLLFRPPWWPILTGGALGLGLAVANELAEVMAPDLLLRLLRLLVPAVLAVLTVFLLALALRGLGGLPWPVSPAGTLLAMALAGVGLVAVAVDARDDLAAAGPVLPRAARALALLLPLPAGLAAWSVAQRVQALGLTPGRLAAGLAAAVLLAYGLAYAAAVLRGRGWMDRVRRANRVLALAVLALAALWLTPLLNAEALSSRDLVARVADGRTTPDRLDLAALARWGLPGARALDDLEALARARGDTALAAQIAAQRGLMAADPLPPADLARALVALMPVVPAAAAPRAAALVAQLSPPELTDWLAACRRPLPQGGPGCVLVFADFWPDRPGDEAMALLRDPPGYLRAEGFLPGETDAPRRSVLTLGGAPGPDAAALIAALQAGTAAPGALPLRGLGGPDGWLVLVP